MIIMIVLNTDNCVPRCVSVAQNFNVALSKMPRLVPEDNVVGAKTSYFEKLKI